MTVAALREGESWFEWMVVLAQIVLRCNQVLFGQFSVGSNRLNSVNNGQRVKLLLTQSSHGLNILIWTVRTKGMNESYIYLF